MRYWGTTGTKHFSDAILLTALLALVAPASAAQDDKTSWRTYVVVRDWGLFNAESKCSGSSHYGGIPISVNVRCLIFDWHDTRFWLPGPASKPGLFRDGRRFEELVGSNQRSWSGFLSGASASVNVLGPPHAGLVGFYKDAGSLIKVRVQFIGPPGDPLSPEGVAVLFDRLADDLGLIEFHNGNDFETKLQTAREEISKKDKIKEEEKRQAEQAETERNAAEASARAKQREHTKPNCKDVYFTGYAAVFPPHVAQIYQSQKPDKIVASNPISCTYKEWGGTYLQGGGVINQSRMTECTGVGYFTNKKATIIDWTKDLVQIRTDVDFDTGRRPLALFIRRGDARCIK